MTPEQIGTSLAKLFGDQVKPSAPDSWQIETSDFRLLVLLSEDKSWLRVLIPIAPTQDAQPFLEQILEANFGSTQEVRYALHQDILWGIFYHRLASLEEEDFLTAVQRLIALNQQGIDSFFQQLVETRVRQIVQVSKLQGQSLESTLQMLDRFYEEGLMGEMGATAQSREETLAAWKYQLERLWDEN